MSAAQAFATKEGCKIGFPHAKKAVKANDKFFREFYGKDFVDANYQERSAGSHSLRISVVKAYGCR